MCVSLPALLVFISFPKKWIFNASLSQLCVLSTSHFSHCVSLPSSGEFFGRLKFMDFSGLLELSSASGNCYRPRKKRQRGAEERKQQQESLNGFDMNPQLKPLRKNHVNWVSGAALDSRLDSDIVNAPRGNKLLSDNHKFIQNKLGAWMRRNYNKWEQFHFTFRRRNWIKIFLLSVNLFFLPSRRPISLLSRLSTSYYIRDDDVHRAQN